MKKSGLVAILLILGLWLRADAQSLTETQRITHLLNRIGFGPRPADIEEVRQIGISKYIDQQLHPEAIDDNVTNIRLEPFSSLQMSISEILERFQDPLLIAQQLGITSDTPSARQKIQATMQEKAIYPPQKLAQELAGQKLVRAVSSERQLQEVMADFWYNHFNIFIGKGLDRYLTTDFEMTAIRQEVARAFTGWSIAGEQDTDSMARISRQASRLGIGAQPGQRGDFMFRPFMHDTGEKTVLGHTIKGGGGIGDGEQVIDILANHPSTARFIATKLVPRFVSDTPPPALVDRVSATYMKTDGDIREMLRVILTSSEFSSPESYQAKTKSPLELVVSSIRALGGRTDGSPQLVQTVERMGQPLYRFEAPTGFPDRASYWMNNGVLVERINFGIALTSNRIPGTKADLKEFKDPQAAALYLGSPEFQKK